MNSHHHEHSHEQTPEHAHEPQHAHTHGHHHQHHNEQFRQGEPVLTIRATSGLSGDMTLAGLAQMCRASNAELQEMVAALGLASSIEVSVNPHFVNEVQGWQAKVDVPHEHAHRSFADIRLLLEKSGLELQARELAVAAFAMLAEAEAKVHGKNPQDVCFHEVGALDSIVDIGLSCALFARLGSPHLACSPLPLGDGGVHCAHGWLPTPAPAVLQLLEGVAVQGFSAHGETVTPTAITLLKTFGAKFGPWPAMTIERQALIYGGKVFANAPNGAIWAVGTSL